MQANTQFYGVPDATQSPIASISSDNFYELYGPFTANKGQWGYIELNKPEITQLPGIFFVWPTQLPAAGVPVYKPSVTRSGWDKYPARALRAGVGGRAVAMYDVTKFGRITNIRYQEEPAGYGFGDVVRDRLSEMTLPPATDRYNDPIELKDQIISVCWPTPEDASFAWRSQKKASPCDSEH